jgi:hypothetical protein
MNTRGCKIAFTEIAQALRVKGRDRIEERSVAAPLVSSRELTRDLRNVR